MLAVVLAAICLVIVTRLVPVSCSCLVMIIATTTGLVLALRANRLGRIILAMRRDASKFPNRPGRSERRAMRAHLRCAIRQTELRSLFPLVADRVDNLAVMILR